MDQRLLVKAAAAGALAGAAVLGILGRVATAILALSTGLPVNVSVLGLVEVALMGTAAGALGGMLLAILRRAGVRRGPVPGVIVGSAVFVVMLLVALAGGRVRLTATGPFRMTMAVVAAVCVVYGITANALLSWLDRGGGAAPAERGGGRLESGSFGR